jgi:hypothetical protein
LTGKASLGAFRFKTMSSARPLDEEMFANVAPFDERGVPTDEGSLVSFPEFIVGERLRAAAGERKRLCAASFPP